jgi:hypothetical protein
MARDQGNYDGGPPDWLPVAVWAAVMAAAMIVVGVVRVMLT